MLIFTLKASSLINIIQVTNIWNYTRSFLQVDPRRTLSSAVAVEGKANSPGNKLPPSDGQSGPHTGMCPEETRLRHQRCELGLHSSFPGHRNEVGSSVIAPLTAASYTSALRPKTSGFTILCLSQLRGSYLGWGPGGRGRKSRARSPLGP